MKVGTLLYVVHDTIEKMVAMGLLLPSGDFASPNTEQDIELASFIEGSLKQHGVDIPDQIDKVMKALPLVFSLVK